MRNFIDVWSTIFDDRAKPLQGRITFYESGTTDLLNVYATDGETVLPNPMYTDHIGKTQNQILLQDMDYTIVFERYIGSGDMESDNAEDSWYAYKTVLSKANDTVSSVSDTSVDSIDELKAIEGMENGQIITVNGYYEAGDSGMPRNYIWHSSGNATDDGGIIIKSTSTNTGYWKMVIPGSYIDVRWYGDIPDTTTAQETSNLSQRALAATGANTYKKDLYFPAANVGGYGFYFFDGSNTVSVAKDIICDNGVRFVVESGTTGTAVSCHELKKCERYLFVAASSSDTIGGYSLSCDWIKASWFASATATASGANVGYILDEMNSPLTFTNTRIKIENAPVAGTVFNGCEIVEGASYITNPVTMYNMELKTEWFASDYDWSDLTIANCTIILQNCQDADTYIILKNKQNDPEYGDLGEQEINATVLPGAVINNASGTITSSGTGSISINNFSGTMSGFASWNINAVDAWITLDASVIGSLTMYRGSITGTFQCTAAVYVEGVAINATMTTSGVNAEFVNCTVNNAITGTYIAMRDCTVNAIVTTSDLNGVVDFVMQDNTFTSATAYHLVAASTSDSVVNGKWVGNNALYSNIHWVQLDRTNLATSDASHSYIYSDNGNPYFDRLQDTRTLLLSTDTSTRTVPYIHVDSDVSLWISQSSILLYLFSVGTTDVSGDRIRITGSYSMNDNGTRKILLNALNSPSLTHSSGYGFTWYGSSDSMFLLGTHQASYSHFDGSNRTVKVRIRGDQNRVMTSTDIDYTV